jgi:ubiquitin C-terminal hydrolase
MIRLLQQRKCDTCDDEHFSPVATSVVHVVLPQKEAALLSGTLKLSDLVQSALTDTSSVNWRCQNCGVTSATKSMQLTQTGCFMFLSGKRSMVHGGKPHVKLLTPLVLEVSQQKYNLVAVVFHHGRSSNNGHYTCLVNDKQWLYCDDSTVHVVNPGETLEANETRAVFWCYYRGQKARATRATVTSSLPAGSLIGQTQSTVVRASKPLTRAASM